MDIAKLKIDKFNNINTVNFPSEVLLDIDSTDKNNEVIIFYIDRVEDIKDFVDYVRKINLTIENRTIMVYRKGRKDINRDSVITPFKSEDIKGFKLKASMLYSLSKDLVLSLWRRSNLCITMY